MSDDNYRFKILLVGDSAVGKSCLVSRFVDNTYSPTYFSTIGMDFKIKSVFFDGKTVKLQIWDTAGQERFKSITTSYYRGAHGIILVYDVTRRDTFNHIAHWYAEIRKNAVDGTTGLLVGNKVDCEPQERQVDKPEAEQLAASLGMEHLEVSAKTDVQVGNIFVTLAQQLLRKFQPTPVQCMDLVTVPLKKQQTSSRSKQCCF